MNTPVKENWHLDRRVPVALILAIVGQTVAIAWWAATAENRIATAERDIAGLRSEIASIGAQVADNRNTASRIDERIKIVLSVLEKIEHKLDGTSSK